MELDQAIIQSLTNEIERLVGDKVIPLTIFSEDYRLC
jgi:hypothetical protein